ncbi:hypothetical protein N7532_008634 [Penicillium argentinense]|uniref:HIT-type domain-containing protein n=1 Tax=Penicillium argentinense TaxID=1131581 RepID=A0A9W9EY10_9EURO|nr:uncharacterized protein N7532_008634 [Penicillium argentinense]KAJ5089950.1 hypothetical protein N7532_008634 [Penicillium argentinense]
MFRVEVLPGGSSQAQPGYTYVTDRGLGPSQAATAPTLSRKRGIRDAGKGGDISSQRANAIARHIAELNKENHRDVQIAVPVKQAKEAGVRKTREKTTSNVRRILQSQKTFNNYLDDEEAAIAQGGGGLSAFQGGGNANVTAKGAGKAAATAAARRSSTPATGPAKKATGRKRILAEANSASQSAAESSQTEAADGETQTQAEESRPRLLKTEHDNDPLLRSYAPNMPSDRIMQRLLAEPPLSYNASRAAPPLASQPPRGFCCICGYWGKIRCKNCHVRTCGLDCYRLHEDSRCGAFY